MEIRKANLKFKNTLSKRKVTTEIILHCTASVEGVDYTIPAIHSFHLIKGWAGIGYNYVIDINGVIWDDSIDIDGRQQATVQQTQADTKPTQHTAETKVDNNGTPPKKQKDICCIISYLKQWFS